MNRDKIIRSAKGGDEKVGFSLKLPSELKDELQKISEAEKISMNALIVATLEAFINDDCGKELKLAKRLLLEYRKILENELEPFARNEPSNTDEKNLMFDLKGSLNAIDKLLGV